MPLLLFYTIIPDILRKENYDSFVGIRDNINCLNKLGVCSQERYDETLKINDVPNSEVYEEAKF